MRKKAGVRQHIAAVDPMVFAADNDDGRKLDNLKIAQIVLFGLSCTGKTTVMMLLARQGLLVANCPIVPNVTLPPEVLYLDDRRCFILELYADELSALREERLGELGDGDAYSSMEQVEDEVLAARMQTVRHPKWTRLHVSRFGSAEGVANEILRIYRERFPSC